MKSASQEVVDATIQMTGVLGTDNSDTVMNLISTLGYALAGKEKAVQKALRNLIEACSNDLEVPVQDGKPFVCKM